MRIWEPDTNYWCISPRTIDLDAVVMIEQATFVHPSRVYDSIQGNRVTRLHFVGGGTCDLLHRPVMPMEYVAAHNGVVYDWSNPS